MSVPSSTRQKKTRRRKGHSKLGGISMSSGVMPIAVGNSKQKVNKMVFLSQREMLGSYRNFSIRSVSPHRTELGNNRQA